MVDVLYIPSSLQNLQKSFDINVDIWSLCRLTGHMKLAIQCSEKVFTFFVLRKGKTTASYPLLCWSSISNMHFFPWDSGSELNILRGTCQNGWLGFLSMSEYWCFCFVPFLFVICQSFLSKYLPPAQPKLVFTSPLGTFSPHVN